MPYITTPDGVDLHFHDWGSGTPVVLIHGWPLNSDMWEYQATFLALRGYRVISYDRRGFGKSTKPFTGFDYDTLADDLAALMNQLDLHGAALVGMSMGGGEVVRYLSRHGSARVGKAVLLSAVPPFLLKTADNPDGVDVKNFDSMREKVKGDRFAFLKDFAPKFYGRSAMHHAVSEALLDWTFAMAIQATPKATYDCIQSFGETDFRAEMKLLGTPFLVIHGTGDSTVPNDISGKLAARILPNARLIEYEGAAHGLFATEPDRLNHDLLDFLGGDRNPVPKLTQI